MLRTRTNNASSRFYAESAVTFLATHLLFHYCIRKHVLREYIGGLPPYKLKHAIAYINEHWGEDVSLEAIANQVGISRYHFARMFKKSLGMSPHKFASLICQSSIKTLKFVLNLSIFPGQNSFESKH